MDEKINSSFSDYKIDFQPASSYLTGDLVQINVPYAASQANNFSTQVDEMDLSLTSDVEAIENSIPEWWSPERIYLEEQRKINNEEIERLQTENDDLNKKYEKFLATIPQYFQNQAKISELRTEIYNLPGNYSAGRQAQLENQINQLEGDILQYINEHQDEFKSIVGMGYEEYNQKLSENNFTILDLKVKDYRLRQEAKELPYKEISETEEFQNYILTHNEASNQSMTYLEIRELENYLDEEQLIMFSYLYDTKGSKEANAYLDAIEDKINQAKGMAEAQVFFSKILDEEGNVDVGFLEYNLETIWQGLRNGVETFDEGLENLFDITSDGMMTDNQYAQQFILQGLSELQASGQLPKYIDDTYQISTSIGNMLPGSAISILTYGTFGQVLMGMSAAGNAKNEALVNISDDKGLAYAYGLFNGVSEAALGELMGNIPGLNEGAKLSPKGILSEGAEEFIQTYADAGIKAVVYGENPDLGELSEEGLRSFLYGCINSGVMTGTINFTIKGVKYTYNSISELMNDYSDGKLTSGASKTNVESIKNTNVIEQVINSSTALQMIDLKKVILGTIGSIPSTFYYKTKSASLSSNNDLMQKCFSEGLYHITDESSASKILGSGCLKASGSLLTNYGFSKNAFMFSGVPRFDDVCLNVNYLEKMVAVKINPTLDSLMDKAFKYRNYDDYAIMHENDYYFDNQNAELVYLGLDVDNDGNYYYKEISKQDYDNYANNIKSITRNSSEIVKKLTDNLKMYAFGLSRQYDILMENYKKAKELSNSKSNLQSVNNNIVNDPTDNGAIALANEKTRKGATQTFRFSDVGHIPDRNSSFWTSFKNPELILINVNGRIMTLDDAVSYKMQYDLNASGVEIDVENRQVVNNATTDSKTNLNDIIKNLVQQQGINETMKGLWHYVYGNDLSYIPEQFRTVVQQFNAETLEALLTYDQIKSIADSGITTVNQNDTFDDLKEMKFNVSYDSNDLGAIAEMISIGKLLDIIRDTSNFNEFIQKNDSRIIDVNYYVAFVQFVNVIKENNYNMRFNQLEQQRLEKIYNEALEKLPINKIQYNKVLPNDIKLKLMIRDNIVYDRDLLLDEVRNKLYNIEYSSNPYLIFDDLFLLYREVSKTLTFGEIPLEYSDFDICDDIYLSCLRKIMEQNIYLDKVNFKKIAGSIGKNIWYSDVQEFLNKYLCLYPDVYLDTSELYYRDSLPIKIKEAVVVNILEKNDWFLSRNGSDFYGIDQGVLKKYMEFRIKNLAWLTSETDFLNYLQNVRGYSLADANKLLNKYKSLDFSNYIYSLPGDDYHVIIEYIYDKCYRENRFDVIDIIEKSFGIKYINETEIKRLGNKLINQGMTESEALRTIYALDSTGVCSYADVANAIVLAYKDNIQKFEEDFGYPLYVYDNGRLELNAGELLLDMYTYINSNKCGSTMFSISETGELHVNNLVTNNQIYLSSFKHHNTEDINAFLKSKNSDLSYELDYYNSRFFEEGTETLEDIKKTTEKIINHLNKNGSVGLGILHTEEHQFRLIRENETVTTNNWSEGGGHAVCITGVLDNSFIVSSWGKRYRIPFSDFINNKFNVIFRRVEGIK